MNEKIEVIVNGDLSENEINVYVKYAKEQAGKHPLIKLEINASDEEVELVYYYKSIPFERIRRITGYLVGTTDRFNNGKRAELDHRVKHHI